MSPSGGFFSSLFSAARRQSGDVYGKKAAAVLFLYVVFALAAVIVPVAVVIGISVFRMTGAFDS